jgi:RsmE family RNA methyltransferase
LLEAGKWPVYQPHHLRSRFVSGVNLILFDTCELSQPLPRDDRRAQHLLGVLRRQEGDTFDAGVIDGRQGKGRIVTVSNDALTFEFSWEYSASPAAPIRLVVGMPRPQTARDILRDVCTLGVEAIDFVLTERGDRNYARSTLWVSEEWRRHLLLGAEQAFDPRLPRVTHGQSLRDILAALPSGGTRLALDNYESPRALSAIESLTAPVVVAIGSERGWSGAERDLLRGADFLFVHLGTRVLRTETACIAALTLVRAKLGFM